MVVVVVVVVVVVALVAGFTACYHLRVFYRVFLLLWL